MDGGLKHAPREWNEEEAMAIRSLVADGIKRERAEALVAELGPDQATLKAAAWVEKNLPDPSGDADGRK